MKQLNNFLQTNFCLIIFSEGSSYNDYILSSKNKYKILGQDFNNHSIWISYMKQKNLKDKIHLLNFHKKYNITFC